MSIASKLLAAALLVSCGGPTGQPKINAPLLVTLAERELIIDGSNFGRSGTLLVAGRRIPSTDPSVRWSNGRVVTTLPAGVGSGPLTIESGAQTSNVVPLEVYDYRSWPMATAVDPVGLPLALNIDSQQRLWVNLEFGVTFQVFDPATSTVTALPKPPQPNGPGPFALYVEDLFGVKDVDAPSQLSMLGEDVVVDSHGRIWFSQGGGWLYDREQSKVTPTKDVRIYPNHSRVICWLPATASYRVYNMPGDRNEVFGLAWDGTRIWAAASGRTGGGALIAFDPERTPFDAASPSFDFSTSLDSWVNRPDGSGYQLYNVPDATVGPLFMVVDPDGHIWFTTFYGSRIGRLDPTTGTVDQFPLPRPSTQNPSWIALHTDGLWRMALSADGSSLYFDEAFDFEVGRLDAARARAHPEQCAALDANGRNPCIATIAVAEPAPQGGKADFLHTLALDAAGRLWYTHPGFTDADGKAAGEDALGIVLPDLSYVAHLPSLRRSSDDKTIGPNGLVLAPTTGDLWFVEYYTRRVSRLHKL